MNIKSYTIPSANTPAALASCIAGCATGLSQTPEKQIAVPVQVRDDQFFAPADPGQPAVVVVSGEESELTSYLDYFLSIADPAVAPSLVAQYAAIAA